MHRLPQNQRFRAFGMVQTGVRHEDIAARFGFTQATITGLLTRYGSHGTINDLSRLNKTVPVIPLPSHLGVRTI